jgi:hypothetical protein
MDVLYSLKPLAALTMTPPHHLGLPTPQFSKFGPQWEYLMEQLSYMLQIAHKNTSNGSIGVYDMQFDKVQHFIRVFGTIAV